MTGAYVYMFMDHEYVNIYMGSGYVNVSMNHAFVNTFIFDTVYVNNDIKSEIYFLVRYSNSQCTILLNTPRFLFSTYIM